MKWPRALRWIVPSLLLVAATAQTEIIERVVVKVNGEILTMSEFTERQVVAVQQAQEQGEISDGPGLEEFLRRNNSRILEEAIEELLLVQRAGELGITAPPQYVDAIVDNIKKENGIESDDQFARQLRQEGMTLGDLRRSIRRSVLRREVVMKELTDRTEVGDAEVIAEYDRRKAEEFTVPASVTLQEIVVDDERRARALVAEARVGADFAALARTHSSGPTAGTGGDLGSVPVGDLSPAIATVVADLEPGGVSEPLKLGEEYRIYRLVLRTEAEVMPFDEVADRLRRQLTNSRRNEEYQDYIADLRSKAVIDYRVREVATEVDAGGIQLGPADAPAPAPEQGSPLQDLGEFEGLEAAPGSGPTRVQPQALPGEEPEPTPTPPPE